MSSDRNYEYEVALSFAGEDRPYASQLANILRRRGVRFFFDEYEKYTLWGKNLKWAVTLTQQYDIKNWYAIGATEVGQTMLERTTSCLANTNEPWDNTVTIHVSSFL